MDIGTSFAGIDKKYSIIFTKFLDYIYKRRVNSNESYDRAADDFIAINSIYASDYKEAITKSIEWISETLPGFKSLRWDDEKCDFDHKDGFDIFYQYAPTELTLPIKNSGQKVLDVYSKKFATKYASSADIYKALADMASNQKDETRVVIKPAVLKPNEKVDRKIANDVISNYQQLILSATNLEEFSKALNAIAGAMGLNLKDNIVTLAKIANKLREMNKLPVL